MQPIYFFPGLTRAQIAPAGKFSRGILAERGMDEVFSDLEGLTDCSIADVTTRGPGDTFGCCVAYQTLDGQLPDCGYFPDKQTWSQASESVWIGLTKDQPVRPEDIRRKVLCSGHPVDGADGNYWEVPVIRSTDGDTSLPCDTIFDMSGKYVEQAKSQYLRIWEDWLGVVRLFQGMFGDVIKTEWAVRHAVRALAVNYRIGVMEQSVIKCVDSTNFLSIVWLSAGSPDANFESGDGTVTKANSISAMAETLEMTGVA